MATSAELKALVATLWPRVREQSARAQARGALEELATEEIRVEDGGVRFVLRQVSSRRRKERARKALRKSPAPADPFVPGEPDLFVADLGPQHRCLLNKFNVFENHVLIVTRTFEHQETLLTQGDLRALWICMGAVDGLGFYNGGEVAGASQPHKHLQLVPLPMASDAPGVPIERALGGLQPAGQAVSASGLPFGHALVWLEPELAGDPERAAARSSGYYQMLLAATGLCGLRQHDALRQSAPYNLLVTRRWMLLVPRTRERCLGVSVNALGFAGSLLVRDSAQLEAVRAYGPMGVLRDVAGPRRGRSGQ